MLEQSEEEEHREYVAETWLWINDPVRAEQRTSFFIRQRELFRIHGNFLEGISGD